MSSMIWKCVIPQPSWSRFTSASTRPAECARIRLPKTWWQYRQRYGQPREVNRFACFTFRRNEKSTWPRLMPRKSTSVWSGMGSPSRSSISALGTNAVPPLRRTARPGMSLSPFPSRSRPTSSTAVRSPSPTAAASNASFASTSSGLSEACGPPATTTGTPYRRLATRATSCSGPRPIVRLLRPSTSGGQDSSSASSQPGPSTLCS
jgi:hypothetical protein